MKSNVDLTQNSDFRNKNGEFSIAELFKINTLPWEFKGIKRILSTLSKDKKELIYTGDKLERQSKKQCQQYMNECECCGLDLSQIPWKNKYKLCEECYARLENNERNHKPFWRNEK
ncbi:hypothetical protein FDJ70_05740 [Clostridium botulinum]|nr:hypothetical protein [Clostridium botulinum]